MSKTKGSTITKFGPCPKCGFRSDFETVYNSHFSSMSHRHAVSNDE